MKILQWIFSFVLGMAIWGPIASAMPILEPWTHEEHFDTPSVGPWSSYPPAQDTAYDPTICVKNSGDGGLALYREITPDYETDTSFGVRRLLNIYVTRENVLTFRAYIKTNRPLEGVKIKLGYSDGVSAEKILPVAHTSAWQSCSVNLGECGAGSKPKKLSAVAFIAVCPHADPENLIRFGLDDVKITGLREQQWQFTAPMVHKLDEWTDFIAANHYRDGGAITISVRPPQKHRAIAVRVNRALTDGPSAIFPLKKAGGGIWSVNIPFTAKSGIGPGLWRATVLTTTKEGETLSGSLVFLVKSRTAPARNPRLLMGPGEAKKILGKAASGRLKTVWDGICANARSTREKNRVEDFSYNLDVYDEINWLRTYGGYVGALRIPSAYIRSNGVVYGLSGDTEAGDAACRALVRMAQWPSYVHPHILNQGQFTYWPVGQMLGDMAVGYDMVRDRLSPADRAIVAEALYSKGITEVFKEYVRDNRVSSFTSNWIGDVTGGGILCALAVMNDYQDTDLEPYLTGMILKMDSLINTAFDRDGHYGEGYSYLNHALECINVAAPALERTFGIDFPDKLAKCYRFLLYQTNMETNRVYDFGDTANRLGDFSNFSWILSKYKDTRLKWLYDRSPGESDVDLFFDSEGIPSNGPADLPKTVLFRDTGTAVFRSGFGRDDFLFVFRCGPFFNHQHFDQGGFFLSDRGDDFLTETGRADYYFDPWYRKLFIQPGGHNCILLDDDPESQRAGDFLADVPAWKEHAFITDFLSYEGGAFVSGCLDPLYKGNIGKLRRSVLYLAPRTIVLIDEAAGPHGVRTLDLRFHVPRKENITLAGNNAFVNRPGGKLIIQTLAPDSLRADIRKRPLSTYEFDLENPLTMKARGFLQLSTDIVSGPITLVHAISTDDAVMNALNETRADGCTCFSFGDTQYAVNTTGGGTLRFGDTVTDALVCSVRENGFLATRMTELSCKGETLVSSDRPVSLIFRDGEVKSLAWSASGGAEVTFRLSSKPLRIMCNGRKFDFWTYNSKSGLHLTLAPGEGNLDIR